VRSHRVDVAIFAIALTVFGLVELSLVWSGDWPYASLANLNGVTETVFRDTLTSPPVERRVELGTLLRWHHLWSTYVIGLAPVPPEGLGTFTADEYAHMADVRGVFRGAQLAAAVAFVVAAFRLYRARAARRALRLLRDGALVAAAIVAVIGLAAAVAFEPLFLLFHDVFFPQGNFLFDPATSNLIRLYPEWYWQGITAGVGVSFIALALLSAALSHLLLRRRATTYTRAG
jgi:integral membrane protein (TIGR01906 family)